jgi:hypothetical protein
MLENEEKLHLELDEVKADREKKMLEYQNMLDSEKQMFKAKLREAEGKGTRVEVKQTGLLLGFEKEKAKWEQEKSFLMNQKEDAVDHSTLLEKKVENLFRENEKLKNDLRNARKNMYQATANTSTFMGAKMGE